MWAPSAALDKSISMALAAKGAHVIHMYCDSVQSNECNYIGGSWGNFSKDCKNCKKRSEQLWEQAQTKPIPLSKYISLFDRDQINEIVLKLSISELLDYENRG